MRWWMMTLVSLMALLQAGSAAAQAVRAGSVWVNQFESTLAVTAIDGETGALKGTYVSRLGEHCVGTRHDAVGWVDGDRVVFAVRWKTAAADCKSITSWSGYLANGKIVAFWDLVYISSIDGSNFVHRGTDIFEPCVAGKPKGCPQDGSSGSLGVPPTEAERAAAEKARAEAEARRRAEAEAARAADAARTPAETRRQAEAAEAALRLPGKERRRVQVALTSLGFDTAGADEVFGIRTRQMIAAWQKKQGMPETGFLTAPQLAALQRQAAPALARFDAAEKVAETRRKAEEDARRKTQELADAEGSRPEAPPQVAATAPPADPSAPTVEVYKGFSRVLLYDGQDPAAFAEYTIAVTLSDGRASAVITRYCPACVNEGGEERKSFTCAADRLRGRSFNLRCDDVYTWGTTERARVHYSSTYVDIPLVRVQGSGG